MPLFFTPPQADELLPEIEKTVLQIMDIKKTSEKLNDEAEIADATQPT